MFISPPTSAAEGGSWVGKQIMVKKANTKIGRNDVDGHEVTVGTLEELVYTVLKEDGPRIQVKQSAVVGWIARDDAVLLNDAVSYFTKEIRTNPRDARAYAYRGWATKEKGDLKLAIEDMSEAIRLEPKVAAWYDYRGVIHTAKKDYDQAIADYTEAIRLDAKNAKAYRHRGLAYRHKEDYERAIADYAEAIRLDPNDAKAYSNRGTAYDIKGEHDRAIADYTENIRLDPKDAKAYYNRGLAYQNKKDYESAIAEYTEAIRLDPKLIWSYTNRGNAYLHKNDYDRVIADYSEAIRIDPNYANGYRSLAWLLATARDERMRNGKKAVEYARTACELTGWKKPDILETLAAACAEARDFKEAVKWQKKALESADYDERYREFGRFCLKLYEAGKTFRDEP